MQNPEHTYNQTFFFTRKKDVGLFRRTFFTLLDELFYVQTRWPKLIRTYFWLDDMTWLHHRKRCYTHPHLNSRSRGRISGRHYKYSRFISFLPLHVSCNSYFLVLERRDTGMRKWSTGSTQGLHWRGKWTSDLMSPETAPIFQCY